MLYEKDCDARENKAEGRQKTKARRNHTINHLKGTSRSYARLCSFKAHSLPFVAGSRSSTSMNPELNARRLSVGKVCSESKEAAARGVKRALGPDTITATSRLASTACAVLPELSIAGGPTLARTRCAVSVGLGAQAVILVAFRDMPA